MSKRKKLLEKIRRNPRNVAPNELQTLLGYYGFQLKRTRGSHYSFEVLIRGKKVLLVVPFHHPLKVIYVKEALDLIDQIEQEQGKDDE